MNKEIKGIMPADEINSNIAEFQHAIVVAELNYDIWWIYKEKDNRTRYINVMNKYPLYFQTSLHAHFVAMIMPLYRLYETRKDTMNVPQLIRLFKKHSVLTNDKIKKIETDINSIRPLWRKVHTLRNNMFGHRSNTLSDDDIWTTANVTPNQFKKLIDDSKALVNNISRLWSKSSHAFNLSATDDTIRLLEDLKGLKDKKL
jgi:hypothetical protein